ncbi:hypothetical protein HYC85_012952 [Camellia sinensis]|uniref:Uncharacterized protein n=1 Tax=Camellia sinensis TaxID=4442 RepID=A0A7J7HDY8_CAMSI|nr:hypothetical protein HYC85_012952 [Camellia sinensis]
MGLHAPISTQIPDAVDWLDLQFGQTMQSTEERLPMDKVESQRSKECPIRWQLLVLKDPSSKELLAAVENEKNLRSRRNACHEDYEMNIHAELVMLREGEGRDLLVLVLHWFCSVPPGDLPLPDVQHMRTSSPEECQTCSYEFSEGDSPTFSTLRSVVPEVVNVEPNSVGNRDGCNRPSYEFSEGDSPTFSTLRSVVPEAVNVEPNSVGNRNGCNKPSPESPQRPSSSEFLAFSDSVKSKFSLASARYKESISKSTRGFKEKLLAHNISVKELGRGSPNENAGESVHDTSSPESPRVHCTFPSELDISLVQTWWKEMKDFSGEFLCASAISIPFFLFLIFALIVLFKTSSYFIFWEYYVVLCNSLNQYCSEKYYRLDIMNSLFSSS